MASENKTSVKVETRVKLPAEKVWEIWTRPEHITHWNFASDDWKCPRAENDLRPGGTFVWRMEAKDGSVGFDFGGIYEEVKYPVIIASRLGDGRKVYVEFHEREGDTTVTETFETEDRNPVEFQKKGWQAILDNFRKYAESNV
jgi:uncharacterized protein YndB with AHSA1/START domain